MSMEEGEVAGEIKVTHAGAMKKGSFMIIDGVACRVTDTQTSKPGKHGHSKVRIAAVGILDDKRREYVGPAHDNVNAPIIEKRSAQVLSISGSKANVMDSESFETFDLDIPEELKETCKEGCEIVYWQILDNKVMKQIK